MKQQGVGSVHSPRLPAKLRALFWDYDFAALTWGDDCDLIIGRVLAAGNWEAVTWLRSRVGDRALRDWIEQHQGRGLSPQQLYFWELVVGLPHRQVNRWLAAEGRQIWQERVRR